MEVKHRTIRRFSFVFRCTSSCFSKPDSKILQIFIFPNHNVINPRRASEEVVRVRKGCPEKDGDDIDESERRSGTYNFRGSWKMQGWESESFDNTDNK